MRKQIICLFLLLYGMLGAYAQVFPEKGVPLLQNFTPAQYHNKGKVWAIRSAPNGMVYMVADKGLLEYDGKNWKVFKGSNGFTRSLMVVNDSLIYSGSDLDFGVWKKNNYQAWEYTSLYPFQEVAQDINEEFWQILQQKDEIIFVSSSHLYLYKNQQLVRIDASHKFSNSFQLNGTLYFADETEGLKTFDGFSFKPLFEYPRNQAFHITGLYQDAAGLVIVTRDDGLYRYAAGELIRLDNTLSQQLKAAKVFSFERIGQTHLAFGTVLRGLYIADLNGNIIHHVNRHKGLPVNTVLAMHHSPSGKLWLGLDYGVSVLNLNNQFTTFYDYKGDYGAGYTALLKDGIFYLGSNQGLYRARWEELSDNQEFFKFQLIPETEGQVWTLENIDNTVLMGHDRGLLVVQGSSVEKLGNQQGVWTIVPYKNHLLTGNYNGISIYEKSGTSWKFRKKMDLILGSCNQLMVEQDNILWINIPNFGVIRAVLDDDLNPSERLIFPEKSFDGDEPYFVKNEQGILLFTSQFQYRYNTAEKKFEKLAPAEKQPVLEGLLPGIFPARVLDTNYAFYPSHNGFVFKFLHPKVETAEGAYTLVFRKIEAFGNEEKILVHPGMSVPYRLNNFKIEFTVPNREDVLYQYKLNDADTWSEWSSNHALELIGLSEGENTFYVQAKVNGKTTGVTSFSLSIAAPWYRTWGAYASYLVLAVLVAFFIHRWKELSLKKQKEQLWQQEQKALQQQAEKHQQKILLMEQARLQAEYDHMKQQLRSKTIELANKAKENEARNRLLLTLKEKCEIAQANPSISKLKWKEMERLLDSYLAVEDKTFEIQMDELHQEFFKKLKAKFPGLSNHDLLLCAYIKTGINSKEIAEILNIQPSSFYISRSRLRRKLDLTAEENLFDFLNGI